jgi:hypothetical protein
MANDQITNRNVQNSCRKFKRGTAALTRLVLPHPDRHSCQGVLVAASRRWRVTRKFPLDWGCVQLARDDENATDKIGGDRGGLPVYVRNAGLSLGLASYTLYLP